MSKFGYSNLESIDKLDLVYLILFILDALKQIHHPMAEKLYKKIVNSINDYNK